MKARKFTALILALLLLASLTVMAFAEGENDGIMPLNSCSVGFTMMCDTE